MPPFRLPAHPFRTPGRRHAPVRAAALGALTLFALSCSNNQVAGTSSGVDNPSLTVSFASAGTAARVTGALDVYAADQNPAVDPQPLATINVKNSAFTLLTGDDFKRAQEAAAKRGAAKRGAAKPSAAKNGAAKRAASTDAGGAGDRTEFNLVFTTQDKNGDIAFGLAYDSAARAFTLLDSSVRSVAMEPKPLIRYRARVAKDSVHGDDCRIFVPGSPYLATLVDSQFVLVDLPQGVLPLRLIGSDGKIYSVADSLDTDDSDRIYRPGTAPTGSLDTVHAGDSIPEFQVHAPAPHDAYLDVPTFLEATVTGIPADDPRLSVLWKWLPEVTRLPDSLDPDLNSGKEPPPSAELLSPTSLRTEVRFHGDGVFRFLVTATVGARAHSDTALVSVLHLPPPEPAVLHPAPAESLVLGRPYTVQWQMPGKGPYTLEVSTNNGGNWVSLASHYASPDGLQIFPWTPSSDLGPSGSCLLRVQDEADTTRHAVTPDFFSLIQ